MIGIHQGKMDVFKFLEEFRAAEKPACPVVMGYFISEFFGVKFVKQDFS